MVRNEARGIMRQLATEFASSSVQGYQDIQVALVKVEQTLAKQSQPDLLLIRRLANYITYTVFNERLSLTATQKLLVSQLMALGRHADGRQLAHDAHLDQSQF